MNTEELLEQANLRYSSDDKKGYTRKVNEKSVTYFDTAGEKITNQQVIDRINSLAIPPAWVDVWICPHKNGYLQATGFDSKGRKQYRYHPQWVELSQQQKFDHLFVFAETLPAIRSHITKTLNQRGLTKEKVLATVVWLLENTLIRVGNEEYEQENKSYGLTTLKNRHVDVKKETIYFSFKGKSGVYHEVQVTNRKVAKIIKQCHDLPGQDLFEYRDENGAMQTICSQDVNEYLKDISGKDITAKNYRTWAGTITAAKMLDSLGTIETPKDLKKNLVSIVKKVAGQLRNLPSTAKKYYIHPAVFEAYSQGYTLSNVGTHKKYTSFQSITNLRGYENNTLALVSLFASV
jgi:DNA topoisomerase-1